MQYAATTETCNTCQTTFHHLDRDEDGRASIPSVKCADPSCDTWLCLSVCLEHFGFHCDGCGHRFCLAHLILIPDGADRPLKCCAICAAGIEMAPEPVIRRYVMLAEAGCTLEETAAFLREVA